MRAHIRYAIIAGLCSALTLLLGACDGKDKAAIQAVWDTWDKATGSGDGKTAAAELTASAVAYWEAIRQNAMDGRADDIARMAPSDQAIIFRVRLVGKRADLKGLDGKGFYAWYVAKAAEFEPPGVVKMQTISVNKDTASAELRSAEENPFSSLLDAGSGHTGMTEQESPKIIIRFEREGGGKGVNGVWKIDDTSLLEANDKNLRRVAKASGRSIRELIEEKYFKQIGEQPPEGIWKPMKK